LVTIGHVPFVSKVRQLQQEDGTDPQVLAFQGRKFRLTVGNIIAIGTAVFEEPDPFHTRTESGSEVTSKGNFE
jgi:hypothetical protein